MEILILDKNKNTLRIDLDNYPNESFKEILNKEIYRVRRHKTRTDLNEEITDYLKRKDKYYK